MIFKKVTILVLFFTWGVALHGQSMDLENIRTNYVKAVSDKKLCLTMLNQLSTNTQSSLHLVYLGAFQTIWAKHVTNPFSKIRTFNRGKKNIDEAVSAEPNNIEIRIVRLSVQINSPSFLGYRNNIDEDKKFIQANNKNITSTLLREVMAILI